MIRNLILKIAEDTTNLQPYFHNNTLLFESALPDKTITALINALEKIHVKVQNILRSHNRTEISLKNLKPVLRIEGFSKPPFLKKLKILATTNNTAEIKNFLAELLALHDAEIYRFKVLKADNIGDASEPLYALEIVVEAK